MFYLKKKTKRDLHVCLGGCGCGHKACPQQSLLHPRGLSLRGEGSSYSPLK